MRSAFFNHSQILPVFLISVGSLLSGSDTLDWVLFGLVDRKWLMLQGQVMSLEIQLGKGFGPRITL